MRLPGIVLPLALLVAACGATPGGAPTDGADDTPLRSELVTFSAGLDGCDRDADGCTWARLVWPRILAAPTPQGKRALEEHIDEALLGPATDEDRAASPEQLVEGFFQEYRELNVEMPDMAMPWALERVVSVAWSNERLATIRVDGYDSTGGAHPNSFTSLTTFDLLTGGRPVLEDLFVAGAMDGVRREAETAFRAARGLAAGEDLAEAGFWFDDGGFALPDNWGVVGNDLVFYFNAYDVAPYALGPTEFKLPLARVERLVRPEAVLAR